jgi:hypothetical protein
MRKIFISLMAFSPALALAADPTIEGLIGKIRDIMNLVNPLLMVIVFAVFLWGIIKFITAAGDENKRKEAKNYIIYGLIGIFVLIAWWGIIQIVLNTFFGGSSGSPGSSPSSPIPPISI